MGDFTFDCATGFSDCDPIDQAIIGSDKRKLTHSEVAQLVTEVDRQKFIDVSLGKPQLDNTSSTILRLTNGNVVRDAYTYIYHPEDYAQSSLQSVRGITQLIGRDSVRQTAYRS